MKKLSILFLTLCAILCGVTAFACGGGEEEKVKVNLVDYEDKTINVEYGGFYTIESFVYDTDGKSYALASEIKDNGGNAVAISDKTLLIEKAKYVVTYTVDVFADKTTKTVTINAYRKPIITVDKTEVTVNVDVDGYYLPEITAVDGDGKDVSIKKEIYYSDYLGDEKTDYNGTDENYRPKKAGTYYLLITATDENGFSNTEKVVFYGESYGTSPSIVMNEDYAKRVKNLESGKTATFVSYNDLPDKEDYVGVGNGEVKGAVKIDMQSANRIYMSMNYSAKALSALDKEEYNRVIFAVYFKTEAETFMINGNQKTVKNPCFMHNYYGVSGYNDSTKVFDTNKWLYINTSLDNFIECFGGATSTDTDLFLLQTYQYAKATEDKTALQRSNTEVYIGNINVFYQEPALFNATPYSADFVIASAEKNYVGNSTLKGIFDEGIDYYDGGAIKLSRTGGQAINVTLGLSAEELTALKSKYNEIVFNIGVVFTGNTTGAWFNTGNNYKNGLMNKVCTTNSLADKTWYTKTVSIDDFIAAINDSKQVFYMMTGVSPSTGENRNFDLYIGDIEFTPQYDNLGEDKTWQNT